jgi:hypothetical protein
MPPPTLTFACELDTARLTALFDDPSVLADLKALQARVVLMLSDYRPERAQVVAKLNDAGIPVTGVPLVPTDQGYYFTPDNVPEARASYARFTEWTNEHGLVWDGVGLDIEPDAAVYQQIMRNPWGLVRLLVPRLTDTARPSRARADYAALVERIHADGWPVENYQMPPIADERRAGSTLLQRVLGLVDLPTDREVFMNYTSFMRGIGPGLLWSYGPEAAAIAVGTTGGGPDVPGHPQMPTQSWEEFARDLRLARHFTDQIYVHSLEGCVGQGFLGRLRTFDWSRPASPPDRAWQAALLRRVLRAALRASAHPWLVAGGTAAAAALLRRPLPSRGSARRPGLHEHSRRPTSAGSGRSPCAGSGWCPRRSA